jgi:hypothetical protein
MLGLRGEPSEVAFKGKKLRESAPSVAAPIRPSYEQFPISVHRQQFGQLRQCSRVATVGSLGQLFDEPTLSKDPRQPESCETITSVRPLS